MLLGVAYMRIKRSYRPFALLKLPLLGLKMLIHGVESLTFTARPGMPIVFVAGAPLACSAPLIL